MSVRGLVHHIDPTVSDTPADYPRHGPPCCAVFFADPDGLKLEYVHGATASER